MGLASLRGREDRDSARAGARFATVDPAQRIGRHGTAQGDTLAPRLLPRDGENVVIDVQRRSHENILASPHRNISASILLAAGRERRDRKRGGSDSSLSSHGAVPAWRECAMRRLGRNRSPFRGWSPGRVRGLAHRVVVGDVRPDWSTHEAVSRWRQTISVDGDDVVGECIYSNPDLQHDLLLELFAALRCGHNTDFTSHVRLNLFFVTAHETCSTPIRVFFSTGIKGGLPMLKLSFRTYTTPLPHSLTRDSLVLDGGVDVDGGVGVGGVVPVRPLDAGGGVAVSQCLPVADRPVLDPCGWSGG